MESSDKIKSLVKQKYGQIAQEPSGDSGCCDTSCCCSAPGHVVLSEDYSKLEGYNRDADLGLGCGIPTEHSQLREGQVVVDLGSGAGNDVFVARRLVGEKGMVIGIDMTEAMIEKARANNAKMGYTNVEFRLGDIEHLPVADNTADVVISNCVLNLVPDKRQAFREIFRIIRPGGRFAVSDIVLRGELPAGIKSAAEMYVGCVAGAIRKDEYLEIIRESGFRDTVVAKETVITLPDEILTRYLKEKELKAFKSSGVAVLSTTITARKPDKTERT